MMGKHTLMLITRRFKTDRFQLVPTVEPKKLVSSPTANPPHPACIAPPGHRHYPSVIKRRLPGVKDRKDFFEVVGNTFRSLPHWHEYRAYPIEADFLIIGAGLTGSSIAYFLSKRAPKTKVVVLEKDHTYAQAGTVSPGFAGFRSQFTLDENVQLTMSTIGILRDEIPFEICRNHVPRLHVPFHQQPYLILFAEEHLAVEQENAVTMQNQLGGRVELLSPEDVSDLYPWLQTDNLLMASCGQVNEGWLDPYDLLSVLRTRATGYGSQFVQAYVVGFDKEDIRGNLPRLHLGDVLAVDGQHNLRPIRAARVIIAAGSESALIAARCGLGTERDYEQMRHPLPVTPYERKLYVVYGPKLPFNCPLIVDPSGVMFTRPDGWPEGYVMALDPLPCVNRPLKVKKSTAAVEPIEAKTADSFDLVAQVLSSRIKNCGELELLSTRTANVDLNYFDGNWILGQHPYIAKLYFACGSTGSGVQHCLAVGRSMAEIQFYGSFRTLHMERFSFDRLVSNKPLSEMIAV